MSEKNEKKRSFLSLRQQVEVMNWLASKEEWLKSEGPDYPTVAAKASADLGFAIGESNIRTCADAARVTWKTGRQKAKEANGPSRSELAKRLEEAGNKIANLDEIAVKRFRELEGRMEEMTTQLTRMHAILSEVQQENGRLRIMATAIADEFSLRIPAAAGMPPRSTTTIPVANGPRQ